jgi:hypothetical protein
MLIDYTTGKKVEVKNLRTGQVAIQYTSHDGKTSVIPGMVIENGDILEEKIAK